MWLCSARFQDAGNKKIENSLNGNIGNPRLGRGLRPDVDESRYTAAAGRRYRAL